MAAQQRDKKPLNRGWPVAIGMSAWLVSAVYLRGIPGPPGPLVRLLLAIAVSSILGGLAGIVAFLAVNFRRFALAAEVRQRQWDTTQAIAREAVPKPTRADESPRRKRKCPVCHGEGRLFDYDKDPDYTTMYAEDPTKSSTVVYRKCDRCNGAGVL